MENEKWKKCCLREIKRIWKSAGGPMNVVRYQGTCPICGHFIGLTQTSEKDEKDFLKPLANK